MPLSEPAPRDLMHRRAIEVLGYERADGQFDIEATLTDTKTYAFTTPDRGEVTPGTPLHRMLARMTVDHDMLITAFEADTEFGPFAICPSAAPNFAALAGITIGRGFTRAVNERVGGTKGCTHLRELLGQMGTVAFQTMYSIRMRREAAANAVQTAERPTNLNTCLAYASDSPVVQRLWPDHYTGG